MGYIYMLILLAYSAPAAAKEARPLLYVVKLVRPAVVVALTLSGLLILQYGVSALCRTLLPIDGLRNYGASHFGLLFGRGRDLWLPGGANWRYYVGTIAGFWLIGTGYLLWRGAAAFRLTVSGQCRDLRSAKAIELTWSCATLHLAFILFLFGHAGTWSNYSYILLIGLVAAGARQDARPWIGWLLVGVAVLAWKSAAVSAVALWTGGVRDAGTYWLFASAPEAREWKEVLSYTRSGNNVILSKQGAAALMFPSFERPVGAYLLRGMLRGTELEVIRGQLEKADLVVVPQVAGFGGLPPIDPSTLREHFRVTWVGRFFRIYGRQGPRARQTRIGENAGNSPRGGGGARRQLLFPTSDN